MQAVKWGEYRLGDLFDVLSYKQRFDANKVILVENGGHPYIVRQGSDNGQKGFIDEDEIYLNDGNTISFGQDTATMFYQEKPYFTGDKIKILKPKMERFGKDNAQFFLATMRRSFSNFGWGTSSFSIEVIENQNITLPITENNEIDFDFMESFIRELEEERIRELQSYLAVTGLSDYTLTLSEQDALVGFDALEWREFNVESLFGKSTRGKRLKGDDRIEGDLPFVTAGEADTGISAFISNDVEVFSANTTTIDMFGSAKYRNYDYGADDHVAVVHTENLNKYAAIFVTTACHKSAHNGQFNYGHNFYAKDADELNIMLPVHEGMPDYEAMQNFISAVQKLVIKDVVKYADKKIGATKKFLKNKTEYKIDDEYHYLTVAESADYNGSPR
ncbi:MAG: restriction endonuclease subunit S [Treponema sp.]|nr:restriction endonuclease subunit S [Treponema sp.]